MPPWRRNLTVPVARGCSPKDPSLMKPAPLLLSLLLLFLECILPKPAAPAAGPVLILPQNRSAFYAREPIELAVAGLARGASATIELVSQAKGLERVAFRVTGDGSTVTSRLPAFALAPAPYVVRLDGKDVDRI